MSLGIQRRLRQRRQYGSTKLFDKQVYADQYIMSNLTLERELPGHTGCVNTLDWSSTGDKLLTGSDDTKLNIYLPFENYELQTTIDTGHRANIFTAKFMPQTSGNIIVSGGGDSEIRIFDLTNPEKQLDSMYVCHSDQLKKICVYEDNPHEFLSCSQDGTVRHFDRRTPHLCSPHNVRSFITAQSKPARQHPLPDSKNARHGCPSPIVNYGRYNIELSSMTISKLFPQYFAVAGMNDYIYLHDRRMTNSNDPSFSISSSSHHQMMDKMKCIKRFSPTMDGLNRPDKHITACKFSDTNGYELLGSWSSDGIYLFNINDDIIQSSIATNTSTNNSRNRTASNESPSSGTADLLQQKKEAWESIFLVIESSRASNAVENLYKFLQEKHPSIMDLDGRIGIACVYMMEAHLVCRLRTRRDTWYANEVEDPEAAWSRYFFEHELTQIQKKMEDAEALVLPTKTWQAYWCLAIGYWTLRGGHETIANHNRQAVMDKALNYANKAMSTFKQAAEVSNSSSSSTTNADTTNLSQMDGTYLTMMQLFIIDWQHAAVREGALTNEEIEIEEDGISGWSWERLMYITLYSPDNIESFFMMKITEGMQESEASSSSSSTSSFTSNEEDEDEDMEEDENDEDEEMTEDEVSLYTRIMSRQIMDIYRGGSIGDESENSDLDLEELAVLRESAQKSVEADVGVVKPRMKYTGHCNIETIKDVDFFGPNDEYIVSGSDGGYLFIWDKKTGKILQILQADQDIVNVAKGHPTLPILAVSGIDSTTKIFTPTSKPHTTLKSKEPNNPNSYSTSSHLYEEQDIVSLNRENNQTLGTDIYITRSMIAALSRISRVHRLRRSDDDDDEDEGDENDDEDYDSNRDDSDSPSRLYRMIEEGLLDEDF